MPRTSERKRKAPTGDEVDSDTIEVAGFSTHIGQKRRRVLAEQSPEQAQNKRYVTLQHVLIPPPLDEDLENIHRFSSEEPATSSIAAKEPFVERELEAEVEAKVDSGSTKRPRRAAAPRRSLAELLPSDDESEDEIVQSRATPKRKPSKGKAKAVVKEDSSDYEEDEGLIDDDDDVESDELHSEESSVATESEDEFSDDGKGRQSSRAATSKKGTGKAQKSSVSRTAPESKGLKTKLRMQSLIKRNASEKGLNLNLPPLSEIDDIFSDITSKALNLGLQQVMEHFGSRPLRVATMCSGTESPILALQMIQDALPSGGLEVEHLFSAEIVPFKQAYIERNFNPPVIFRDITELTEAVKDDIPKATTAYGAKVEIPTDIDMVIAGTSCVDFSRLNSHRKDLSDVGESGNTWRAVLSYCTAFRPAIVILENVFNAHWDQMLKDYEEIGYEVAGVEVDTKDFYIPQTRQRGYMVCFDSCRLPESKGNSAASSWVNLMSSFKRYASSPVSSFLMTSDQIVTRESARQEEPQRVVDWSACEISQMQYRQTKRLGNARPFTHWQESGAMLVPDNGSKTWYSNQVERVLDTIDGAILRKALPQSGAYDCRYKTRVWNLSQNIYRDEDNQSFGLIGCITPSGQYFVSDAGRAMTAEEVLKLQGLPLDMISFTTESPAEMQDLAGNAMSSSVIGSAILSALISGYKAICHSDVDNSRMNVDSSLEKTKNCKVVVPPMKTSTSTIDGGGLSIAWLLDAAQHALRRCYCERDGGLAKKPLQQCRDCGHTTCITCGGNPAHNYQQRPDLGIARTPFSQFEADLRAKLPLRISLGPASSFDTVFSAGVSSKDKQKMASYAEMVTNVTREEFHFSHLRRTHCITVTYGSSTGQLVLVIGDNLVEWRLYAKPDKYLPSNDWLRQELSQAVTVSKPTRSLFDGDWQVRVPVTTLSPVSIVGRGEKLPSWWSRCQMPDFVDHWQWEFLDISIEGEVKNDATGAINGSYQYLPKCGTACDSLYKKIGSEGTDDVFLFLDPGRTASSETDRFVFSYNKALLEYDETRSVIAALNPTWRPWDLKPFKNAKSRDKGAPTLIEDCEWRDGHGLRLSPLQSSVKTSVARDLSAYVDRQLQKPKDCQVSTLLLECSNVETTASIHEKQQDTTRVIKPGDSHFFSQDAWMFEPIRQVLQDVETWQRLILQSVAKSCEQCAPARPRLQWGLTATGDIKPFEDSSGAAAYERAIKSRPDPIVIEALESDCIRLSVNLVSLAHRARAKLPSTVEDVEFDWRCDVNGRCDRAFAFPPFKMASTKGVEPYNKDILSVPLFPKQRLALAWMRAQEAADGQRFTLEQCEEAAIPKLCWSVEMRARAPVHIRGGICADHPGFGKTITSLALIGSEFCDTDNKGNLDAELEQYGDGLLVTKATLIICPAVLLEQWASEIEDKLDLKGAYLKINSMADLKKWTIEDFQSAKIVLVNRTLLGNDQYAERVATFAGIPGPATKQARSFGEWLKYAMEQIPTHLRILQEFGQAELVKHVKKTYAERMKSDQFAGLIPSRRLRGQAYVAGNESKSKTEVTSKAAVSTLDTSLINTPLFEMFYFNRVIIDEFHQYSPREYAAITQLKAHKRWGLSATPALTDLYDVAKMAGLLGVILPIGSDARHVMKPKNIKDLRKEMTDFERFDSMRTMPSNSMHTRLHELHQAFLDTFVRRNVMDFGDMKFDDFLMPVCLDPDHKALYSELAQQLNTMDMRIKRSSKSKDTSSEKHIAEILEQSETAEEALSKTAAYESKCVGFASSEESLESIMELRAKEVEAISGTLRRAIASARSKEKKSLQDWVTGKIKGNGYGDLPTIEAIEQLLGEDASQAVSKHKTAKETLGSDDEGGSAKKGRNDLTSQVNKLGQRLLVANRSLRFFHAVQLVQQAAHEKKPTLARCDGAQCPSISTHDDLGVSAYCGHMVCRNCFDRMETRLVNQCPAKGCSASLHNYHLLWAKKMKTRNSAEHSQHCAKIDAALDLLEKIQSQNDQAILFVQYVEQLDQVKRALKDRSISSVVVDDPIYASARIQEFRQSSKASGKDRKNTVLVLNASDETAAGSNLQNANHAIFLSPLLRDTQYEYDATMAQAIGRVRRHGQIKPIHVYRIAAVDTIDVDIFEHRERRADALGEKGAELIFRPEHHDTKFDEDGKIMKERTQLVREDGKFSLRPQSWLVAKEDADVGGAEQVKGRSRVSGWEDFSSLVKFSRAYTEDGD